MKTDIYNYSEWVYLPLTSRQMHFLKIKLFKKRIISGEQIKLVISEVLSTEQLSVVYRKPDKGLKYFKAIKKHLTHLSVRFWTRLLSEIPPILNYSVIL